MSGLLVCPDFWAGYTWMSGLLSWSYRPDFWRVLISLGHPFITSMMVKHVEINLSNGTNYI
ncbi:hypothetical protein ACFL3I_05405 [Pseudomonadota bacterium]